MMVVNGLQLPASFQEFLEKHSCRVWDLKEHLDAYGQPLVDRFGQPYQTQFLPYETVEQMKKATAMTAWSAMRTADLSNIDPERHEMVKADLEEVRRGFLPAITDYSQIVQFSRTPFCFDFRDNPQEPSVIYMPAMENRWRRIAPNFEAFIRLLKGYEEGERHGA